MKLNVRSPNNPDMVYLSRHASVRKSGPCELDISIDENGCGLSSRHDEPIPSHDHGGVRLILKRFSGFQAIPFLEDFHDFFQ